MPGDNGMRTDDVGTNPDVHQAALEFQDSLPSGIVIGHRIPVTEIGDIRFP